MCCSSWHRQSLLLFLAGWLQSQSNLSSFWNSSQIGGTNACSFIQRCSPGHEVCPGSGTANVQSRLALQILLGLSKEQIQDFLLLRKLYLTKRSLLATQREALIRELHQSSSQLSASDILAKVLEISGKLRQNAAEDYLAYIKTACAARRGVSFVPFRSLCFVASHLYVHQIPR